MNSCKITIQRKAGEQWPVVLEQRTTDAALEIRTVGSLSLNVMELAAQVTARDYGVMLGQALFQGAVRDAFLHARAQSEDSLSVQLFIETPDLRALRWERLCAPLDEHWHFLAHDQRAPLSLAPSSPSTRRFPHLRRENLRALVLVASPQGLERYRLSPFNVEATVASIRAAFGPIPCDVLSTTPDAVGPPTLDALCERLSSTSYSLLHVVCHGRYSSDISDTVIYLANEEQQVDPVAGQRLITRLSQLRGEQGLPQFAFLATCESASPEAEGVLGGLAQCLVRDLGMPAVLAMTETVSISTVDAVTSQFYRHLVAHGQVDLALAEACAGVAERADSLVPALYSRLGARPLFDQQARAADSQPLSLTHQQRKQNRARMLERVQRIWISGVLEQSLHGVALLSLGLQEQPNAVTDPWRLVMQEAEQPARSLSPGTRITQVYDDADRELLILGAPGAGKTTLLLELTRDLLQRAKQDDTHPIPVVFHLSSWAVKRQPLTQWLTEELNLKYQVPRKLAQQWVETDQVLPLLDGLDEVNVEARRACIETINTYHQEHGFLPLVVASRSADYLTQTTRLTFTGAVTIQPLTQQHVDDYLARGGGTLSALRVALQQDTALRELAETPLMLSILTLAYHDLPVEDLSRGGSAPTRQQVFGHYVERVLMQRGGNERYRPEQTVKWLAWLARQMKQQSQTVFYLERIQPDWLAEGRWHRLYEGLAVRLPSGLIGGLIAGLVGLIVFRETQLFSLFLVYMLVGGLIGGLISGRKTATPSAEREAWSWRHLQRSVTNVRYLRNRLIVGLAAGLSFELVARLNFGLLGLNEGRIDELLVVGLIGVTNVRHLRNGIIVGLAAGLSFELGASLNLTLFRQFFGLPGLGGGHVGLVFGLIGVLLSVLLEGGQTVIQPAEMISWSWRRIWRSITNIRHLRDGLIVALIVALGYGLGFGLEFEMPGAVQIGLTYGLVFGLIGVLLSVLLEGGQTVIQPAEMISWSWRRIWRSITNIRHLRDGLIVALIITLADGLDLWLINGLGQWLVDGLVDGLNIGLSYWLLIWLFGGLTSDTLSEHQRIKPNQGIWNSARISVLIGLISGLVCLLSILLINVLFYGPNTGLRNGLFVGPLFGLGGGLLCGLLIGGRACIQHVILRLLLWRTDSIPWNYARFLDYAAQHILLCKVGGGYIFVHRLLLEYFASL